MDSKLSPRTPNASFRSLAALSLFGVSLAAASAQTDPHHTNAPTYLRDVRPIVMRRCSRCHNEQARFVYNWLDYKTAYADRGEIARRIWNSYKGTYFKESMPIANSPESLAISDEERATIRDWVVNGAQKGVPPPPVVAKTKGQKLEMGRQIFSTICAA